MIHKRLTTGQRCGKVRKSTLLLPNSDTDITFGVLYYVQPKKKRKLN